MTQSIERVSKYNGKEKARISLRGSLAEKYYELIYNDKDTAAFIDELLATTRQGVIRKIEGSQLVIGLDSDRGKYYPDW